MTETTVQSAAAVPAVRVQSLSHTYKPARQRRSSKRHAAPQRDAALDCVDLEVKQGETFALLGPNGSGKSTLLRILATVQQARENTGSAQLFGYDTATQAAMVRQYLGVVFQQPALDIKLTAIENLRLHGKLYGMKGQPLEDAATGALKALGLGENIDQYTETFSGGMRRRVEIAKALLTGPSLLLMDEASAGLDIAIQHEIWNDLRRQVSASGLTVLLTTHLMHEAEWCDRVAVMSEGRVVAVDTPQALVGRVGGQVLEITPGSGTAAEELVQIIRRELDGKVNGDALTTHHNLARLEHEDAPKLIQPLSVALGDKASGLRLGRPTLADAYLKLTGQTLSD